MPSQQGDTSGALETLTDADIAAAKQTLGTIASAVPGYNKLDPHCNGFVCNAGAEGINMPCADAFILEAKQAYCGVSTPSRTGVLPCLHANLLMRSGRDQTFEYTNGNLHLCCALQSLPLAQCDVIQGKKIDWVTETAATGEIIAGALATGGTGALEAALQVIGEEMETQYDAFIANAGPVRMSHLPSLSCCSLWHMQGSIMHDVACTNLPCSSMSS